MLLRKETHFVQSRLAEYCRSGKSILIEGANPNRLHHYRRLILNVLNSTLERTYPIFRRIVSDEEWLEVVSDFQINYDAKEARIWMLPFEFYEFCKVKKYAQKLNRPYLDDLLYFEWIEIEVNTRPDKVIPEFNEVGDLLDEQLIINPEYELIHLNYPVHNTQDDQLVGEKGDYFILVYWEQRNLDVRFFEFSAFFTFVFELIASKQLTGRKALIEASTQFDLKDENNVLQNGIAFLNVLLDQGIILGFVK